MPHDTHLPDYDVDVFYGEENDVLDRYWQCAEKYGFEAIVRITSDCPLLPPFEIDRVIEAFLESGVDYATNRPEMPDGFDVEVFTKKSLDIAHANAKEAYDHEHVTAYIYKNPYFKCLSLSAPKLSLDTELDYERIVNWYELERKNYLDHRRDWQLRNEFHPLPYKT